MNILVTGGNGFLGHYVVEVLKRFGYEVISMDNMDTLCGGSGHPDVVGDVTSLSDLRSIVRSREITHIVHLAAYGRNLTCQDFSIRAWDVNVTGTRNVLEMAREYPIQRIICCSSNITLSPKLTVYKATKEAVERLVELYSTLGVSCMGIRPSNIYGRGQSKTEYQPCAFAGLDKGFAKDGFFTITGDGTQRRDWIHAQDVARAFHSALFCDKKGVTLDVCTGRLTSLNRVAEMLGVPVRYSEARRGDAQELVSYPGSAWEFLKFIATESLECRIEDAFPEVVRAR